MITNGRLEGVPFVSSPNHGGALTNPTLLVIHYTASGGDDARSDGVFFSTPQAKASAHFIVGRDGGVIQCVSTAVKAWHAGVSSWRGRSNCNDYSIGIEVDNYGYVLKGADGVFHPGANLSGVLAASEVVEGAHKHVGVPYHWWENYKTLQIDGLVQLSNIILATYPSITEIVGHEDIAPGRKIDPGPAFPWFSFRSRTIGRAVGEAIQRQVIASTLNVRTGPDTDHPIIDRLTRGEEVTVVYDVPGAWAQVVTKKGITGFVNDTFLAEAV